MYIYLCTSRTRIRKVKRNYNKIYLKNYFKKLKKPPGNPGGLSLIYKFLAAHSDSSLRSPFSREICAALS